MLHAAAPAQRRPGGGTRETIGATAVRQAWTVAIGSDGLPGSTCGSAMATDLEPSETQLTVSVVESMESTPVSDLPVSQMLRASEGLHLAATECELFEPSEISPVGTIEPLRFVSKNQLRWGRDPNASAYNVYVGDLRELPLGDYGSCSQSGVTTAEVTVTEMPAPGQTLQYLVNGYNTLGEGPIGFSTKGPRWFPRLPAATDPTARHCAKRRFLTIFLPFAELSLY